VVAYSEVSNEMRLSTTEIHLLLKVKRGGGNLSVQITCNKSKVIYKLEDKGGGEFISIDMQQIQGHLQAEREERKGNLLAQIACNKPEVTYLLEGEERGEFISTDSI